MLGREVDTGKVIRGNNRATLKVNTIALSGEAQKLTEKIGVLISSTSPPEPFSTVIAPSASSKISADRRRLKKTTSACSQASPRLHAAVKEPVAALKERFLPVMESPLSLIVGRVGC
jgi:hypothetical protein